jgi:hypothetical protein
MGLQFVASALLGVDRDGRIGSGCEGVSARLNRSPGVSLACPLCCRNALGHLWLAGIHGAVRSRWCNA